ncbi:response regulator containing a CheY-like receiver domain and an HTH DNA-binding domain [Owenweeksia hongkongensis DSM 17368]|uniref:Response regulator containing a CheY-like receiver domain and an HTH DNA-binding domain n=1 Tax=Owenweeksia hongkongensis (strain DSM 17368 / CIP 108786 / JCM 12287 / NRRL B-23963 / UST20020801) TaxID=926562 RepID=G8R0F0_OWEHD|nr:response regulator transcription factor [Owenweeksia hongkongensis]AEV31610.1 response regulator containing a CheY-like receiver domain and an HTH DNA-binding domain [Owenweeksia hongkongensis DSM 17368]
MDTEKDIKVMIVEDDDEIRELMHMIIGKSPGYDCVAAFRDCESALKPVTVELPEVVLMDIELPGMNGIEGIRKLKEKVPETDFIMLTIRDDDESVFESLKAGATGYLLKDTPPARLLEAIREVHEGGSPITPSVARRVTNSFHPQSVSPLSDRETEVLARLCEGEAYNTIAERFFISGHTVRAHIKNIYRKLQVNSRGEAVKTAIKDRLI